MLHLRLTVDAKCPRHPLRQYQSPPAGCGICQELWEASLRASQLQRALRGAERLGAELRWRNIRRRRTAVIPAEPTTRVEQGARR